MSHCYNTVSLHGIGAHVSLVWAMPWEPGSLSLLIMVFGTAGLWGHARQCQHVQHSIAHDQELVSKTSKIVSNSVTPFS